MMKTTPLRDVVAQRLEGRWHDWARRHPSLAAAIDRTRLIDQTVDRLRDDPQFQAAMRQAHLDEKTMLNALALLEQIDRWLLRLLP